MNIIFIKILNQLSLVPLSDINTCQLKRFRHELNEFDPLFQLHDHNHVKIYIKKFVGSHSTFPKGYVFYICSLKTEKISYKSLTKKYILNHKTIIL